MTLFELFVDLASPWLEALTLAGVGVTATSLLLSTRNVIRAEHWLQSQNHSLLGPDPPSTWSSSTRYSFPS
jgi:hypothetical protein